MEQVQHNDPRPARNSKIIYFLLIAIFVAGIVVRYYGYQQPHGLTFDEGLYADLIAEQLKEDFTNYSTQEAYQMQTANGVKVPDYLDRPLFKHPPLYNYFIALNYQLFGSGHLAAVSVSILMGCLMIPLVFLLGKELYDERVGLFAAFLLCIDPIHWICSEKIWMESTMAFFSLLAVYLFVLGQKQKYFLLLSGISIGLAMLTKYPGALPLFIIISYAVLIERSLFREKNFWGLCVLTLLVFSPWVIWNWNVYGSFFNDIVSAHGFNYAFDRAFEGISKHIFILAIIFMWGVIAFALRNKITSSQGKVLKKLCLSVFIFAFIAVPFMRGMIAEAFVWKNSFTVGWTYPFADASWHFYLTKLSELSPIYLFAFFSVFLLLGKNKGDRLLFLSALWILVAFTLLRNFQSRYIIPAVPFLIILSARFQVWAYDQLSQDRGTVKLTSKAALLGIGLYFIIKTFRADMLLAIGPDFGYF